MLFNNLKHFINNDKEDDIKHELDRILSSRSAFRGEPDNPFSFGVYNGFRPSISELEASIREAIETFYSNFVIEDIEASEEDGRYSVEIVGHVLEKRICFTKFF